MLYRTIVSLHRRFAPLANDVRSENQTGKFDVSRSGPLFDTTRRADKLRALILRGMSASAGACRLSCGGPEDSSYLRVTAPCASRQYGSCQILT
ncbi:hypothetical protein EVAR_61185_1 [Eumeta japonica]|uniref:Uncharacterized protein n=1 Tax=Eumeta variegata TaxID=151549 RepID=A0A4C1YXZ6_EUMVA|nr:hypothetical protein EVAR_61185_1 [Eumeta japonica]